MDRLVNNNHFLGQKEGKEGKKNLPSSWAEDEAACPWGPRPLFHPSWEGTMTSPLQTQASKARADQARRLPEEQEALGTDSGRQSRGVFPSSSCCHSA